MREDADVGIRKRDNYKGRKRGDIWGIIKRAEIILSMKHLNEWEKLGINKASDWSILLYEISEAFFKGVTVENMPKHINCGGAAIDKMLNEMCDLKDVMDIFKKEIEKSLKKKTENDKTFLKTINAVWGKDAKSVLDEDILNMTRQGRQISLNKIHKRIQKITKIIQGKEYAQLKSGKDYLALKTRLCSLAYHCHKLLFQKLDMPDRQVERLKRIEVIKSQLSEYHISPFELIDQQHLDKFAEYIKKQSLPKGFGLIRRKAL